VAKESDIQKAILEALRAMGIFAYRNQVQSLRYTGGRGRNPMKGAPDLIGIIPPYGTFLGIEVKKPGGKVSKEQQEWIDNITCNGGLAFVCDDPKEVEARIAAFLEGKE
jgi:hypothetical protein